MVLMHLYFILQAWGKGSTGQKPEAFCQLSWAWLETSPAFERRSREPQTLDLVGHPAQLGCMALTGVFGPYAPISAKIPPSPVSPQVLVLCPPGSSQTYTVLETLNRHFGFTYLLELFSWFSAAEHIAWDKPCELSWKSSMYSHICPSLFGVHTVPAALTQTSAAGTVSGAQLLAASSRLRSSRILAVLASSASFAPPNGESFKAGEHHQKPKQGPDSLQSWETSVKNFSYIFAWVSQTLFFSRLAVYPFCIRSWQIIY